MPEGDTGPAAGPGGSPAASDSIEGQLHARIDDLPGVGETVEWVAAAAACEREAAERGHGREAAVLLHEAGRIHEHRLGNPEVALAYYEGAVAVDPGHVASLQAARSIAERWGYGTREVRFLEAEARAAADPRRAAELDYARARLLAGVLQKPEEALALLAQAAARDPESLAIATEHGRLAAAAGRFDETLADWRRAAEVLAPAQAAQVLAAAAALAEERLGRPDEAAELALLAFRSNPADAGARALALHHAERRGRKDDQAALLAAEGREATSPRSAALAFLRLARLEEERGSPERALGALAEASRRAPGDPAVLAERARIAEGREAWDELAEVLRARIEAHRADPGGVARDVASAEMRLAEVYEQRLGRPDDAAACARSALAVDPRHREALAALGRHHARRGEWAEVLETFLAEKAASDDPREQAQRCFKAGELMEERLIRPDDAVRLYGEALALDPGLLSAARALERLLERGGRYGELCTQLEREVAATPEPAQKVATLFRLARLREDRLGDLEAAAATYRKVLELDPAHILALRSLAVVLERSGHSVELAVALEHAASVLKESREAVALLTRAGEVREEAGDEAGAAAAWERALAIDAAHLPALRALGRLCARAGRWEELVDMCRAEADALPSAESAAALLARVGEILETRLSRTEEALAAWREALTLSPSQPVALRALARVYRTRGELEPLVEVLRADADSRASPTERAALLFDVADLCERQIGDAAAAAEVHQEALRGDPTFTPSHRALQRLLAAQGRWAELAEACRLEAETGRGPDRLAALWRLAWNAAERLEDVAAATAACHEILAAEPAHAGAMLLLDRMGAPAAAVRRAALADRATGRAVRGLWVAAAIDRRLAGADPTPAYAQALALDPEDPVAGPAAADALRAARRHGDLALLWESREERAATPGDRAELALQAGEAWADAGDLERALAAHQRSLSLAPGSLPALQAIRRIQARRGDWKAVHETLRAEAQACRDPASATAALAQAAEVARQRLDDRETAAADLREATARDPADTSVAEQLVGLLEESQNASDGCELRETRARGEAVPARAAEEWLAAARLAAEQLGDAARAIADLDQALAVRPSWAPALRGRARLLAATGQSSEAARDLLACLALGGEPPALAQVHLELAALFQGPLGDAPRAMSHLNAVLAAAPENAEALGRLARIHREAHNWPAAADVLRRLLAAAFMPDETRVSRLLELAEVRAEGFGDAAAAADLCEQALSLAPGHPAALDLLARVREKAEDFAGLVGALERAAREGSDPARRVSARRRAAKVLAGPLADPDRAATMLREALAEDPACLPAREALAEILGTRAPDQAVEEYRRILEADPGRPELWRALFRIHQQARAHDRAFVAAGVLKFLGASDPAVDGAFHDRNALQAPGETAQALAGPDWELLRHPLDRGPLSALLAAVGEHLGELVRPSSAAGPRLKGNHPVRQLIDGVAGSLGLAAVTAVEGGEGTSLSLDPSPGGRVRVGPEFLARHGPAEQRFLAARLLARLKAGSSLADHLGPGRLGEFLAAAVRQVDPEWAGTGAPGDGLVKQVGKALPRKARREVEELLPQLRALRADLIGWYAALAATADRAGLLLAGDLPGALQAALRDSGPPPARPETPAEIREAVRTRPDLQMLLRFAASEELFQLRQKLRLAIA